MAITVSRQTPIVRSSAGLRNALFEQLDALRAGKLNPLTANAFARLADQVIRTVELEITIERAAAALQKRGDKLIDILPPIIPLGERRDANAVEIHKRWHQTVEQPDEE